MQPEVRTMLVFISDLHFVDETAGKHNIPTSGFRKFLSNIKDHAKNANAKELKIVFLGDIFDILRTEAWFQEDESDRPWGDNTPRMHERAEFILGEIAKKNRATFDLFKPESLQKRFAGMKVETIYIPGNHDRLCGMIGTLKEKVIELIGLKRKSPLNFQHSFTSVDHGVYALHGHCFDRYNYEGGPDHTREDYELVPIGDPITTELIARLPYKLMQKVEEETDLNEAEKIHLKRNFQEIENVRPMGATLKWLVYQTHANRHIKNIIEDAVDEIVRKFGELNYVSKWYDRHDRWYNPFDSADKVQAVLYFLEKFRVFSTEKLLRLADKIMKLFEIDELAAGAAGLYSALDSRIQYIVMGHTHDPLKKAVALNRESGALQEQVYINTGTWRKRYHECAVGNTFIGWKDMTYALFYTPAEKSSSSGLPVFETWSGSLKRDE
jgi:UDP-2,3-diacylglucosamine pyrophosphatase LpxH